MASVLAGPPRPAIEYPDSDGQPIADNTRQFEWIVTIKGGLDAVFRDDLNVFVAGDMLWYAVEGHPTIRTDPDALVAFGRPKGYRGSYMQWVEDNIPPQVVFEILSPGNRQAGLIRKFLFYQQYGVEEYYSYDPDRKILEGWQRQGDKLQEIPEMAGWVSPRLKVRFEGGEGQDLRLYGPDNRPFATFAELVAQRDQAEREKEQAEREKEHTQQELERQRLRAERLAAQLRALGIDPENGVEDKG